MSSSISSALGLSAAQSVVSEASVIHGAVRLGVGVDDEAGEPPGLQQRPDRRQVHLLVLVLHAQGGKGSLEMGADVPRQRPGEHPLAG